MKLYNVWVKYINGQDESLDKKIKALSPKSYGKAATCLKTKKIGHLFPKLEKSKARDLAKRARKIHRRVTAKIVVFKA